MGTETSKVSFGRVNSIRTKLHVPSPIIRARIDEPIEGFLAGTLVKSNIEHSNLSCYDASRKRYLGEALKEITHHNHYVPRFYLRMWSSNKNTIFTYDTVAPNNGTRLWRSASIKNSACWTDFYTRIIDGADNDDIETYFDKRYEAPAEPVFSKITESESLSADEMAVLIDFLIIQMCRTPGWYLKMSRIYPSMFESALGEVSRHLEEVSALGTLKQEAQEAAMRLQKAEASGLRPPLKVDINRDDALIRIETYMGRSSFLSSIQLVESGEVGRVLRSYNWRLVEVPEGVLLPTSDNPVMTLAIHDDGTYSFDGGIGQDGVDIIMPLSPRHFIFTEVGKSAHAINDILFDSENLALIRNAIISNATRYVYARRPIQGIEALRPRIVDADYYRELESTRQDWHQEQKEIENEFSTKIHN